MHIVDQVEKEFEAKNPDKKMPDSQKSKAKEMERAMENFLKAWHHFSQIDCVDVSGIKDKIKEEVDGEMR